ncbi:MAG: (d)CMP kinase [Firmicutes bacterium]|nr:(d)CMP kinase [Bacillota bacterium]
MTKKINIAIDGPAGAGKSTVAKILAEHLELLYIDTGSMYRALTWKALQQSYDFENKTLISELSSKVVIKLYSNNKNYKVYIDGEDVTSEIRQPEVSQHVSLVAQIPKVRENMVRQQQCIAADGGVIMDGRDIGTNVLPAACAKFFITASIEERALRRQRDLKENGYIISVDKLKEDIAERDFIDENREVDPLIPAKDAAIIDTTGLTIEQVVEKMKNYVIENCK